MKTEFKQNQTLQQKLNFSPFIFSETPPGVQLWRSSLQSATTFTTDLSATWNCSAFCSPQSAARCGCESRVSDTNAKRRTTGLGAWLSVNVSLIAATQGWTIGSFHVARLHKKVTIIGLWHFNPAGKFQPGQMWRAFQAFITLERDYYFILDNSHQNIPPSLEKSKFTQRAWGNTEPTELSVPGLRSQSRNTKNSMFSGQTTKFENVSCWQIKPPKTRFFSLSNSYDSPFI